MHTGPTPIARTALEGGTLDRMSGVGRGTGVTAVILAAGRGTRLGFDCKPLAVVGGITLLERAVLTARTAGIKRVVVVVASLDGRVASFCHANVPGVELALASDSERGNGATAAAGLAHAGGGRLGLMGGHLPETGPPRRGVGAGREPRFPLHPP